MYRIRALQTSDLRARRLSGRHKISTEGRHLIDGVPFGKPFLKRSVSARPAAVRKRRRTSMSRWSPHDGHEEEEEADEEEEEEYAPPEENGSATEEDVEGTVIRRSEEDHSESSVVNSNSDHDPDEQDQDVQQELSALKNDMDMSGFHDVLYERANGTEQRRSTSVSEQLQNGALGTHGKNTPPPITQRSSTRKGVSFMPRTLRLQSGHPAQKKRSNAKNPNPRIIPNQDARSLADDSQKGSKLVRFQEKQVSQTPSGLTDGTMESTAEVSSSSSEDESTDTSTSGADSEEESSSTSNGESSSESESEESSSDDDEASTSESESAEESSDKEQRRPKVRAPGTGSKRTKKTNARTKLRRKLAALKRIGALPDEANFDSLRAWESAHEGVPHLPHNDNNDGKTLAKDRERLDFERERLALLQRLESGGVDINGDISEGVGVAPGQDGDVQEEPQPEPAKDTLDIESTKRLIFGALGQRIPRSKDEEQQMQKKLAENCSRKQPSSSPSKNANWQDKLTIKAVECVVDDVELSAPPFPFKQRWDSDANRIISRRRKGQAKGKKRKGHRADYEEEENYIGENGSIELNCDDTDMVDGEHDDSAEQQTIYKSAESDDLPPVPDNMKSVPDLVESELKQGSIIAYKQLEMSRATNWQPIVSEYRVASVDDVLEGGVARLRLARRDRNPPLLKNDDQDEAPREYSGFEMPGFEDEEEAEDEGFREMAFGELIEPKILQASVQPQQEEVQKVFVLVN